MSTAPPPYAINTVDEMRVSLQNILLELDSDMLNTLLAANSDQPALSPLLFAASHTHNSLFNLVERRRHLETMVKEMKKDEEKLENALVNIASTMLELDQQKHLIHLPRAPGFVVPWQLGETTGSAHRPIPRYPSPHNHAQPPPAPVHVPRSPTPPPFEEVSSEPAPVPPQSASSSSSPPVPPPVVINLRDAHDSSPSELPTPSPSAPSFNRRQRERHARQLRRQTATRARPFRRRQNSRYEDYDTYYDFDAEAEANMSGEPSEYHSFY